MKATTIILLLHYLLCLDPGVIIVNLNDNEFVDGEGFHMIYKNYKSLKTDDGDDFIRFEVEEPLTRAVNGLKYFKDRNNYAEHLPINIDVFSQDSVVISFEDDKNRSNIDTRLNAKVPSYLLFKHKTNIDKDLKVDCEFRVSYDESIGYLLRVYYNKRISGKINIDEKEYQISLWKSLGNFRIEVNDEEIVGDNPIFINEKFYKIQAYDPILNILKLEQLSRDEKLYGTVENLYLDKNNLDSAFTFHKINPMSRGKNEYHLFYFWGPWCRPCMSEMDQTSKLLNGIGDNVETYNVSFLVQSTASDISNTKDIVRTNKLPGNRIIEYYSRDKNTYPLIQVFNNEVYPNFVVVNSDYKILKVSSSKVEIEKFMKTLE